MPRIFFTFALIYSLFASLFFSFLYLHPSEFNASMAKVTSSFKYVSSEFIVVDDFSSLDELSSKVVVNSTTTPIDNVSEVQVSDSTIIELGLNNLTSNEPKPNGDNDELDIELPRNNEVELVIEEAFNATVIELVEATDDQDEEVAPMEQASNVTVIEILEKAPPTNKDDTDVEDEDEDENYDIIPSFDVFSNPPWNISRADRIFWLKQKLEESKIIKSTARTRNFDGKMQSFLKQGCTERFFFTWISPASLYRNRELLVLESVLKAHPDACVIILSRTMDSKPGRSTLQPILDQGYKIFPIAPDFRSLLNNTPAQGWLERLEAGDVDPGSIPITQNLSNLLRMVVLYKYGGVYLDTDLLVLKSFSSLKNSIGIQSAYYTTGTWRSLNNAVLIFDKEHPLVWKFMEEFALTFNGSIWGFNGPYLTTRVLSQVRNDTRFQFNVMSSMAFYPIDWFQMPRLFEKPSKNGTTWETTKLMEIDSKSYGVHLWNKFTRKLKIEKGSAMARLISTHCIICQDVYDS
ncbi:uncharacterized protein At4g19900-like [Silene latifolia]|uniref:uncharacterized protein At4g19900-like n=1 Tax=Silene latifolia TaxID=37657 RepID=UPI003D784EB3